MGITLCFLLLVVCVGIFGAPGSKDDDDDYRRALRTFQLMEERGIGACVEEGGKCDKVIKSCCGELQCHWEDGLGFKRGNCRQSVGEGVTCQSSKQCGDGMYCNTFGNFMKIDGTCSYPRTSGACYKSAQCVTDCMRQWWQIVGHCE